MTTQPDNVESLDPRHRVEVRQGQLAADTSTVAAALHKAGVELYNREQSIVGIARAREPETSSGVHREAGAVRLFQPTLIWVKDKVSECIRIERYDAKKQAFITKDLPEPVAQNIATNWQRQDWPELRAVATTPILTPDGKYRREPGYDPHTGLYLDLDGDWPELPETLDREAAEEALKDLANLLRNYAWRSSVDQAVAITMLVSAVMRPVLQDCPAFGVTAPTPGSGKGLLVHAGAVMATGGSPAVMEWSRDREENRKALDATAIQGDPLIHIDNVEHPVGGATLCMQISEQKRGARELGKSKIIVVPCISFITITGNNVILEKDVNRRFLMAEIDPQVERPEQREFDQDLIAECTERRRELVQACHVIVAAYLRANRPDVGLTPLGSFGQWSNTVRAALVWAGLQDPVLAQAAQHEADPDREAHVSLMEAWKAEFGDQPVTARAVIQRSLVEHQVDLREALDVACGWRGEVTTARLGRWLGSHRDKIADGKRIEMGSKQRGLQTWRVVVVDNQPAPQTEIDGDDHGDLPF